jgi:hypothetical protein
LMVRAIVTDQARLTAHSVSLPTRVWAVLTARERPMLN